MTRYDLTFGQHYRDSKSGLVVVYRGCWGQHHHFHCLERENEVITRDVDSDGWLESFTCLSEMEVLAWMACPQS